MILGINLALLVSYVMFSAARGLMIQFRIQARPQLLVRFSQSIVLASIMLPFALHFLPERTLHPMNVHFRRAIREEISLPRIPTLNFSPMRSASFMTNPPVDKNETQWPEKWASSKVLWALWSIGFLFLGVRLLASFLRLQKLLRNATPIRTLGSVSVLVAESISVPFSLRFFRRKWVMIPFNLLENKLDFKLALKHELQHHRQGDTLWAVLIEVLQCLFYFNFSIYGWKNTIIELQEFSCDDALTGQKGISAREYGSCLMRVAETALENREVYVGTTCMAAVFKNPIAFKSLLRRRIEMIMQDQKSKRRWLGGVLGTVTLVLTALVAYGAEQINRNGVNGGSIVVDENIQKITDQILNQAIAREGARSGFAIVADPQTGRILAIANRDVSNKKRGYWALSTKIEPASFMKAITFAEAIEQGVTTPDATHNCENGVYASQGHSFHDWKKEGWSSLSTTETLAQSSDICAMKVAEKLGANQIQKMLVNYGFGPGGSTKEFPGALPGELPEFHQSNDAAMFQVAAYGTDFETTPLEVIQAFGAIANGGKLLAPRLANDLGESPEVVRRVLSEESAQKMKSMLEAVVLHGTASRAPSKLYSMAGKTASSWSGGVMEGDSTGGPMKADIAQFVGFAPVANPKVEIYVEIFSPDDKTGAHGSTHAVPVFTEIADAVLKHLSVNPDLK